MGGRKGKKVVGVVLYIYIYMCMCVCVCNKSVYRFSGESQDQYTKNVPARKILVDVKKKKKTLHFDSCARSSLH